jgi:hypothetical protein
MDFSTTEITRYKDFTIEANPPQLDKKKWGTFFVISRDGPDKNRHRSFDDDRTFSRRLDAVHHCFQLGRQIIDGAVEGRTVSDL